MPETKRKNRMISLRVSEAEYEAFKTLYRVQGARSVSEMARFAMQRILGEPGSGNPLELKIQELDGKVNGMSQELARLAGRFEAEFGPHGEN